MHIMEITLISQNHDTMYLHNSNCNSNYEDLLHVTSLTIVHDTTCSHTMQAQHELITHSNILLPFIMIDII